MPEGDYIAIDWGTTNRRIFVMRADGHVLHSQRDDRGVLAVPAGSFGAEIAGIRAQFGDRPIITAGMIGSSRGLVEVPYRPAPAMIAAKTRGIRMFQMMRTCAGLPFFTRAAKHSAMVI